MKRYKHYFGEIIPVGVVSICRDGGVYRLGYDGYKVELDPDEAYKFYCNIENVLQKSSPEYDETVGIKVVGLDGFLDVRREQLCDIYRFFQREINTGRATFDYLFN